MTKTQKMLRGIAAYAFTTVKPKVARRLYKRPGYRDRFLAKQDKNLAAARVRSAARAAAAKAEREARARDAAERATY